MAFFESITALKVFGLALIAVGAVLGFGADALCRRFKAKNTRTPLIVKAAGAGMVVIAFLIILGAIG